MAEENNILEEPFMSEADIRSLSVSSLANRPNESSGQYGRKGMTPDELKAAFSALPVAIANRLNALVPSILERFVGVEARSVGAVTASVEGAVLTFKALDGETVIGTIDIAKLLSEQWIKNIEPGDGGDVPPTADAVKEYVGAVKQYVETMRENIDGKLSNRVEKLNDIGIGTYLYAASRTGMDISHEPVKVNLISSANTVPIRDDNGDIRVSREPQNPSAPISKTYFGKAQNHPLYGSVNSLSQRVANLESAASGRLCEDVTEEGNADTIQLGNALPFGILSRVGASAESSEAVSRIEIGLPYTLDGAAVYNGNVNDHSKKAQLTKDGVIAPKGSRYGVFIPCNLPSGATVTVYAEGITDGTDTLNKYMTANSAKQVATLGSPMTLTMDCSWILIQKTDAVTEFEEDMEIKNIRIEFSDPSDGSVMTVLEEIEIPEEITSLEGYGVGLDEDCYNYLDLTNRCFVRRCKLDGNSVVALDSSETVDVSEYLPEEFDVVSLAPYCLVRFKGESGEAVSAPYSVSYKKKL